MLDHTAVAGLTTNLDFLRRLARHPALHAAALDTGFIARHAADLLHAPEAAPLAALALAARPPAPGASPWQRRDAFRLHGAAERLALVEDASGPRRITLRETPATVTAETEGEPAITLPNGPAPGDAVLHQGRLWLLRPLDPYAPAAGEAAAENRLSAPIPGRVVQVLVAVGDAVAKGQLLAVLEAMKTEIKLTAPRDGIVAHLGCAAGESVEEGTEIVTLADA
jgi:3-methylcrotonyl-CoA carboxylase alpha subunit